MRARISTPRGSPWSTGSAPGTIWRPRLVAHERVLGALTLALDRAGPAPLRPDRPRLRDDRRESHRGAIESARLYREAEAARRAAQTANRVKDEFLATVSRELRNPLNAVHGWATLIARGQLGEAQTRRAVQVIVRNVEAPIRLVDDLLDMSEIAGGRMRLVVAGRRLHDLIEDALEADEVKGVAVR